jgi:spore germination protein (amino acid permease)
VIKEGKIGVQEAVCLVIIATGNRVFFTAPAIVIQSVGTAGWYMTLIANITTIIFFTFIYLLLKRFPGKSLLEIFNITLGKILGFILSFVYAAAFLTATGILLREFYEILKSFIFPYTPISALNGTMIAVVATAAYLGLETIARVAKLGAFFMLFMYLLLLILSVQNFKLSNLYPVLGYGIGNTIFEGVTRSSAFSEIIVIAVFAGSLQGARHIKKSGYISLILSGLMVSLGIFCLQLIFPYYVFEELTSPLYTLSTIIKFGSFLQRLDPAFLTLWLIITIISSSLIFFSAVSCYCKTFKLQDIRPVILPMAVLLFAVTLIPQELPEVINKYIELLRIFPIFLFYILPITALITAIVRNKKGVDNAC